MSTGKRYREHATATTTKNGTKRVQDFSSHDDPTHVCLSLPPPHTHNTQHIHSAQHLIIPRWSEW